MSAPEFGQRAAHGAEKTPKPSQKCREISSSEISTNNSAASAVVVQTFPSRIEVRQYPYPGSRIPDACQPACFGGLFLSVRRPPADVFENQM